MATCGLPVKDLPGLEVLWVVGGCVGGGKQARKLRQESLSSTYKKKFELQWIDANHQQLRFDLFKRFESYGLALNCNHHVARKLQRLDDWAFEIQWTRIFEVRSLFQLQVFIASLRISLSSKR
ncbi:hypothetical protein Peur_069827 [Populus x canadensis]